MNKLQNGKSLYLRKCNDGIVDARRALDEYVDAIEWLHLGQVKKLIKF